MVKDDNNWFDNALYELIIQIMDETGVGYDEVRQIYSMLSNLGFIDYDTEKELLWDMFVESELNLDEDEDD